MKTIGLLGGMSWESSIEYYRIINQLTREKLGGLHSAQLVMVSVDFAPIEELQVQDRWGEAARVLIKNALQVQAAGADFLLIATNTMHRVFDQIRAGLDIPVLHIADAVGLEIAALGLKKIGLLGTVYTMQQEFYRGRLADQFEVQVLVPGAVEQQMINRIIFKELVMGHTLDESREKFKKVIMDLVNSGAEGIVLGCTEIPMIVAPEDFDVPIFDTTFIHSQVAVEFALGERELDISMNID